LVQIGERTRSAALVELLRAERRWPADQLVRYADDGGRTVQRWAEGAPVPEPEGRLWRASGVYLIPGGAGGLGLVVAEAIAHQTRGARLVLTGRSEPGAHVLGRLDRLRAEAGRVDYVRADVT